MSATARRGKPPRTLYTLLEGRGFLEMAMLPAWLPLLQGTPRGDGHTVLLVPGFTAGDATLVGLRTFLKSRGYHVETWGFGQNTGFKLKFAHALEQKVRFLHHRSEGKVSLVGWSLGGVYSYFTAHAAPECVRTVISLGSPMRFSVGKLQVPMVVNALYRYFAHPMGAGAHLAHVRAKVLKSPPPVPSTCVYSTTDGVVPADAAQLDDSVGEHENIWVPGSHLGLGFNPAVMWILADRLAQPEGEWRPFDPQGLLGAVYERCARHMRTEMAPA
ncbi:MAG TPA: alpha/beta hydrolase [Steroidobacteraceae bacterium]|nr:alpha/beta hydrolase [Steroidobacteraceae bacterium]